METASSGSPCLQNVEATQGARENTEHICRKGARVWERVTVMRGDSPELRLGWWPLMDAALNEQPKRYSSISKNEITAALAPDGTRGNIIVGSLWYIYVR